jgi:hypothetical protein
MSDPRPASPAAIGNVGLMLTTHFMALLLKKGLLSVDDIAAIIRETRTRCTSTPEGQDPSDDWERQTTATLSLIREDVLLFGHRG